MVRFVKLFKNAQSHPLSGAFFDTDHDKLIEIYIFYKQNRAPARIYGQIITWEVKNSGFQNNSKCGPKRRQILRQFQILPQNANRKTFDPHFAKKTVEKSQNTRFSQVRQFLAKKKV